MKSVEKKEIRKKNKGFTLTELLVALAILVIVVTPLIVALVKNNKFIIKNKEKLVAESIASKEIEIIRNLPFADVGTDTGWPHGTIEAKPAPETVAGISFQTEIKIAYIDDPFDGTFPADLYPYDYKKVEAASYPINNPSSKVTLTTNVSPPGPETESDTGILEVIANNANGDPVADADVEITNTGQGIYILTQTLVDGKIFIPCLPPADGYHIEVSKTGYNSAQTYPVSAENPNPEPKDQPVYLLQLTSLALSIDLLSSMTINTIDVNGAPILEPVSFAIHSGKTIGADAESNPIYKYISIQTTSSGSISFSEMEWDSYTFILDGASAVQYAILDTSIEPPEPVISISLSLPPGSNSSFNIILTTGPAPTPSPSPTPITPEPTATLGPTP